MAPLFSVRDLTLRRDDGEGSAIISVSITQAWLYARELKNQGLNLDVEEGEVVIIKGESGSGQV
jgi:ABC-type lipoprotein export system ATPase subunit